MECKSIAVSGMFGSRLPLTPQCASVARVPSECAADGTRCTWPASARRGRIAYLHPLLLCIIIIVTIMVVAVEAVCAPACTGRNA